MKNSIKFLLIVTVVFIVIYIIIFAARNIQTTPFSLLTGYGTDVNLQDICQEDPVQKININTASAEELTYLPGIGPSLAERIIAYRTQFGPFRSIEELSNVPGIGSILINELHPYITVGG